MYALLVATRKHYHNPICYPFFPPLCAGELQAEARALARASNASVYNPEFLALKYKSRPIQVLRRTLDILIALGSFALILWIDQRNEVLDENKRKRAAKLRRIFTRLGSTFMKLGQGLPTRSDICPPKYLEELSELQVSLFFSIVSRLLNYNQ